ncbi:MAG TPA: preprotein translocase subunit SecY [Clostridiales bacterium]|nr:preprotein translocase subunit SecY [Clostridiales bacterium]
MFHTLANAFKNKDVRKKMLITLALLFVYRIGCWLPVPGISAAVNSSVTASDSLLTLLSSITGGALANGAFLAIGISPYINASIIIQLLTVAIPSLERLSKQGGEGRKKLTKITRFATLILAIAQAAAITVSWANQDGLETAIFSGLLTEKWMVGIFVAVMLIAGAMFTLWLGERITENGMGNGISLLIFVGILASAGLAIVAKFGEAFGGSQTAIWELLGFVLMVIVIFALIVFVDLAERKIPVQYAKQIKGRKQYGGQSTYIPLKVNASGVLPIIFATAIITFPQLIAQMVAPQSAFYAWWVKWLGSGTPIYSVCVGLLILFFCYFYAQIQFNPEEVARNIQQYGGFIPGIRPGKPTYEYLVRISKRVTLFGAIYLAFIAIVPSLIFSLVLDSTLVNALSATGMLIVVSVALEFDKQLESQMMMKQYKGFLK